MSLPAWSVRNRVAVNLLTLVCLLSGFGVGFFRMKRDLFPDVSTNFIQITAVDPSTSLPEDIERTVTIPIEEELGDVEGVTKIRSTSQENFSSIFIEIDSDITDIDPIVNEVRQAVDKAAPELPDTVEPPVVEQFDIPMPLLNFTVSYPPGFDVRSIRPVLDRIERRLKITSGVSDVLIDGLKDRELWIELDPFRMQARGVTFGDVADAVSRRNLNAVGGQMDAAGGQRVVRVLGEAQGAEELEGLPVKESGGAVVYLRDLGSVKETMEEEETRGRANLRSAVTFTIVKKRGADAIQTAAAARKIFEEERTQFPPEIETQIVADSTKYINTRIETVLKNGFQALVLVTILLMLLLDWRSAVMVALGIPFAFAGCFLVMNWLGYSINLLSLFAMIMALGMVVDDGIVSCENIFRHYQRGMPAAQAAIRGAQEMVWPVLGSVSTTVAAFLPLIWGEGLIGKFLAVVPVVVISALVFSLIEAFVVLPSHCADFLAEPKSPEDLRRAAQDRPPRGIRWIVYQFSLTYAELRALTERMILSVREVYIHLLTICLRRRYWTIGAFLSGFVVMGVALGLGVVRFQLFAVDFADNLYVKLEMPADASLDETEDVVRRVEQRIAENIPATDIAALLARIGTQLDPTDQFLIRGTNLAQITVDIDEQGKECRKPSEIERDLRNILLEFPEFVRAEAKAEQGGPPVGRAVNMEIRGPDFAELQAIATEVKARLGELDGAVNIADDFPRGKAEFQVRLDEERASLVGVDVRAVARVLQAGFRGIEAASMRWGNDEVTLRVMMDERFAQDPEMLSILPVRGTGGTSVSLGSVANIEREGGLSRISRIDQERVLTVSADVDERATTSNEVNAKFKNWIPELLAGRPGYAIKQAGENEDTEKSLNAMLFAAAVALLLIYALLAMISNSFVQPLVIMAVIPFGIQGVTLGLIFTGQPLGLMSIMGNIALAGIVVNNSVVLVDFINRYRHAHFRVEGEPELENLRQRPLDLPAWVRWRSVIDGSRIRFRPIILTSATTVVGLLSLAMTSSGQEQFLAPMAQAIVWGLSFATLITLVLIPCLYAVLDDISFLVRRWLKGWGLVRT